MDFITDIGPIILLKDKREDQVDIIYIHGQKSHGYHLSNAHTNVMNWKSVNRESYNVLKYGNETRSSSYISLKSCVNMTENM